MLIKEIVQAIEATAPLWAQASWDQSGLQVAAERDAAMRMAVMLDAQPDLVHSAIVQGAGFILAHHPLALKPGLPNRTDNYFAAIKELLGANVALYSAHTSLDVNPAGPAGWLARDLKLQNCHCLEYTGKNLGDVALGYGIAGDLPEPESAPSLVNRLLHVLGLETASLCGPRLPETVTRIAFCGGSGADLQGAALESGAQLFLTGDVRHHAALDARLPILDVGHHSYESRMMDLFASALAAALPAMEVVFMSSVSPFRIVGRD